MSFVVALFSSLPKAEGSEVQWPDQYCRQCGLVDLLRSPEMRKPVFLRFFVFLLLNKGLLANLPLFALEEDIIFIIVARKQVCPLPRGSYSLRPPRLFAV